MAAAAAFQCKQAYAAGPRERSPSTFMTCWFVLGVCGLARPKVGFMDCYGLKVGFSKGADLGPGLMVLMCVEGWRHGAGLGDLG